MMKMVLHKRLKHICCKDFINCYKNITNILNFCNIKLKGLILIEKRCKIKKDIKLCLKNIFKGGI